MQFLGSASAAIPNFGSIDLDSEPLPDGVTVDNIKAFEVLYTEHCEVRQFPLRCCEPSDVPLSLTLRLLFQAILDIVVNLQFSLVEALWQSFWRNPSPDTPQ